MRHLTRSALLLLALVLTLGLAGPVAAAPAARSVDLLPLPLPTSPLGDPPGANDWSCRPSAERPVPVILVHGTFGDRRSLLGKLSRAIKGAGSCVYSLDYGNRGTGEISRSARQLKRFVERVRRSTGARKVSLVGHSQGGMMPRHYLKFLGGTRVVDDLVGLAPSHHGTVLTAADAFGELTPIRDALVGLLCRACVQQGAGSRFLERLNAGDETPGRVSYTQITTAYDEVVVPHTSGYLEPGRRTTNLTLQDACPAAVAEHLAIPRSPTAISWVLDALARRGPASKRLQPVCAVPIG